MHDRLNAATNQCWQRSSGRYIERGSGGPGARGGYRHAEKQRSGSSQGQGGSPKSEAEAEAEGNAGSASSDGSATAAASDADADADAGDARSRLSASPVATNVHIVVMPDLGATMAALFMAVSSSRGSGGLGSTEAELIRSLAEQQRKTSQELVQALQAIAAGKR